MHMIELALDPSALTRLAWRQGHQAGRNRGDDDFGYATHAWLAAAFGPHAPRPFRLLETRSGLRLLGYANVQADVLAAHARDFAYPEACAVCDWSTAASKPMPTDWSPGRRLGFEVRACPIRRGERERDVYLVALEQAKASGGEPASRAEVYVHWLIRQFEHEGAARVKAENVALTGFRRMHALRQSRATQAPRHHPVERPDALFSGDLLVADPAAFARLLARGIGRHRAFGFGMLLLRPPSTRSL